MKPDAIATWCNAEFARRVEFVETLCTEAMMTQEYGHLDQLVVIDDGSGFHAVASLLVPLDSGG